MVYAPGKDVRVAIDLVDDSGTSLTPVTARWRVLNEKDIEIQAWQALTITHSMSRAVVTVPASLNALATGTASAVRRVELEVETEDGPFALSEAYILKAATALLFGVNTFMTYSEATLLAQDFAGRYIQGWLSEPSKADQESALIQAYQRILKLSILADWGVDQTRIIDIPWGRFRFQDIKPEQIQNLDPRLQLALKRAQLIEAAHILTEEGINAQKDQGLTGQIVGESTHFFRQTKPLDLGVCRESYRELARWIDRSVRLGRG